MMPLEKGVTWQGGRGGGTARRAIELHSSGHIIFQCCRLGYHEVWSAPHDPLSGMSLMVPLLPGTYGLTSVKYG